ncbi:cytochrome c1 [Shewanella sp. OPT22]|nr:cytochrome c1 [Shewanella sp. OPT22]
MKKLLIALVALLPTFVMAAGSSVPLEKANIDLHDKASLERGLNLFQQHCSGCHSTEYQRYGRVAEDLGISADDMRAKYILDGAKIGSLMTNAMPHKEAAAWFGATPPDLTLIARVRGSDWVYSYLKGFYKDDTRPFGVNNTVFPLVGMPNVLETLEGVKDATCTTDNHGIQTCKPGEAKGGSMSAEEFDQAVLDITNFLTYSAEPVRTVRESMGWYVLGFLFIFFIISYFLKKEYWRDVH